MTRALCGILTVALTVFAVPACDGDKPPGEAPHAEDAAPLAEPEAPEPETKAPPQRATAPVEADATAGRAEEAPDAAEVLSPEEIARFAVVVAEIDCTADRFEDPAAHDKAVEAILTRAGLTRDAYDAQVMKYLDDATFKATRTQTLEMCKANAAKDPGQAAAGDSLRDKLLALTVAAECMRKQGATTEDMSNAMLALYKAHGIDLETYSREIAALANNQQFLAEITAKTAACPETPAAEDQPDAATGGQPDAGTGGDPGAGTGGDPGAGDQPDAGTHGDPGAGDQPDAATHGNPDAGDPPDAGDQPDAGAGDPLDAATHGNPGAGDPLDAGTNGDPGAGDPLDAGTHGDPGAGGQARDTAEPPPPPVRGVYKGLISPGGKLRVTVNASGGIGASTATVDKQRYRLKGRYDKRRGAVRLGAKVDRDLIQLRGHLDAKRGVIKGTWNGVVDGKRKSGRFEAKR